MKTKSTPAQYSQSVVGPSVLYMAMELSARHWKLAFTIGWGQKPRYKSVGAGDLKRLEQEIDGARRRFGLDGTCRVLSCYEAGRDGFWLHRFLSGIGVQNVVVDAASVEVSRRSRRAKTDRLDAERLLSRLVRYDQGEPKIWSVVRVPTLEQEDRRHRQRELRTRKQERTRLINRIKSLLCTVGVAGLPARSLGKLDLASIRLWDGSALPVGLRERLEGEFEQYLSVQRRLDALEAQPEGPSSVSSAAEIERVDHLMALRGIGPVTAWLLERELFWRPWGNRKQAAALAGLVPSPHASGDLSREQGISKAGLKRVRAVLVELSWQWVRLQPHSELTLWYQQRWANAGKRLRRIGIVAVARKLVIALWRYQAFGVVPEGAVMKA